MGWELKNELLFENGIRAEGLNDNDDNVIIRTHPSRYQQRYHPVNCNMQHTQQTINSFISWMYFWQWTSMTFDPYKQLS